MSLIVFRGMSFAGSAPYFPETRSESFSVSVHLLLSHATRIDYDTTGVNSNRATTQSLPSAQQPIASVLKSPRRPPLMLVLVDPSPLTEFRDTELAICYSTRNNIVPNKLS